MSIQQTQVTRRDAIAGSIAAAAGLSALSLSSGPAGATSSGAPPADEDSIWRAHAHDWDWLIGSWHVQHRRLRERLAGSSDWDEFDGTCINWPLLGGKGNVDDNVLSMPAGTYRGVGLRAFDSTTRKWSIWWLDARNPVIEPPVHGGFENGVGTFIGDDTFNAVPIKVRFRWSEITSDSAHWDQAFSTDGGATWEFNWHMDFKRAAS